MIDPPEATPAFWQSSPDGSKRAFYDQSVIDEFREHMGEHDRNSARLNILTTGYISKLEAALSGLRDRVLSDPDLVNAIDSALASKPGQFDHYNTD